MLTEIITYLQSKLSQLPYLEEVKGLAQLIEQDNVGTVVRFPAIYINGELRPIDFDTNNSLLFFLLEDNVQRETVENTLVACAYKTRETYILNAILYKRGMDTSSCESEAQQMAWDICKTISGKQPELINSTNLDFIMISPTTINLDKYSIWKKLYTASPTLQQDDMLICIKLKIETEGNEACYITTPCNSA